MVTFGSWLNNQTEAGGRIGRFAQHVMYRHGAECDTCQHKERGEELTWGVAEVVREMDDHHAHSEFYELLDEAVAAWGAEQTGRR